MQTDPFPNNTNFPGKIDTFPSMLDADNVGSLTNPSYYTVMWASHYNILNSFIKTIQPLLNQSSIESDGSVTAISKIFTFRITMPQLLAISSYFAYSNGYTAPTNIYPFEFTLTYNPTNYDVFLLYGSNYTPLTIQDTEINIITSFAGFPIFDSDKPPFISVSVGRNYGLSLYGTARFITNAYCIVGTDTILIRGSLIDTATPPIINDVVGVNFLPNITDTYGVGSDFIIDFSIMGVE